MRILSLLVLSLFVISFATQWQPPQAISYSGDDPNFSYENQKMYVTVHDGVPASDNIGYNTWNGSNWVWGGDVTGDIRTGTYSEKEPFITYDNQTMYFVRAQDSGAWSYIYKAIRQGSSEVFNGSVPLGDQINNINGQPYASYPCLTQDQQRLYFTARPNGDWKIYEATWNGIDWDNVTLLPAEINEGDASHPSRTHVCITPDGNELYFQVSDDIWGYGGKLAFSKKVTGVWQLWQYCDSNINPPQTSAISDVALTYGNYETQEIYFTRFLQGSGTGQKYHTFRSPITVQPTSLGSIKAIYGNK